MVVATCIPNLAEQSLLLRFFYLLQSKLCHYNMWYEVMGLYFSNNPLLFPFKKGKGEGVIPLCPPLEKGDGVVPIKGDRRKLSSLSPSKRREKEQSPTLPI